MNIREGMVFGCMTPEEQRALKDAEARGARVQVFDSWPSQWTAKMQTPWYPYAAYRIAPPPVEPFRVDPIVWQVLDKRWRWITGCGEGMWVWSEMPSSAARGLDAWHTNLAIGISYERLHTAQFAPGLIQRGTCPWQEAIAERPEDTP